MSQDLQLELLFPDSASCSNRPPGWKLKPPEKVILALFDLVVPNTNRA